MRRKSDMWKDGQSFLPDEAEQAAQDAAADAKSRLEKLEEELAVQFASMAKYAEIAQQAVETARAEARADLEREKATLLSLMERVRTECLGGDEFRPVPVASSLPAPTMPPPEPPAPQAPAVDISALARIALLEDKFERLSYQFGQVLKSQEELANSIAFMFEQQLRSTSWSSNDEPALVQ